LAPPSELLASLAVAVGTSTWLACPHPKSDFAPTLIDLLQLHWTWVTLTVCGEGGLLQPATSSYLVRDTGNCSPRNMRSTLSQIPATAELLTSANMPLAVLVQPLALLEPGEEPVQVGSFASPRAV
jgi:hypothetical protein